MWPIHLLAIETWKQGRDLKRHLPGFSRDAASLGELLQHFVSTLLTVFEMWLEIGTARGEPRRHGEKMQTQHAVSTGGQD